MEISILPNFILSLPDSDYLSGPKSTLIKKAAGLAPIGTKGQNETSREAWGFFKTRGILKGSQGNPTWAWKVTGWKELAEQYPFLHFTGHLESCGVCHVTGINQRSGGFTFHAKLSFEEKLKRLVQSRAILENLEFLPCCSKDQLIFLQDGLQKLSVLIDKQLEGRE